MVIVYVLRLAFSWDESRLNWRIPQSRSRYTPVMPLLQPSTEICFCCHFTLLCSAPWRRLDAWSYSSTRCWCRLRCSLVNNFVYLFEGGWWGWTKSGRRERSPISLEIQPVVFVLWHPVSLTCCASFNICEGGWYAVQEAINQTIKDLRKL